MAATASLTRGSRRSRGARFRSIGRSISGSAATQPPMTRGPRASENGSNHVGAHPGTAKHRKPRTRKLGRRRLASDAGRSAACERTRKICVGLGRRWTPGEGTSSCSVPRSESDAKIPRRVHRQHIRRANQDRGRMFLDESRPLDAMTGGERCAIEYRRPLPPVFLAEPHHALAGRNRGLARGDRRGKRQRQRADRRDPELADLDDMQAKAPCPSSGAPRWPDPTSAGVRAPCRAGRGRSC